MSATEDALQRITPELWLPKEEYTRLSITRYISVGSTAALLLDVSDHVLSDVSMLRKPSLPNVATASIGDNCFQFQRRFSWLFPVALGSSSLLFFLRIRAVFHRNPGVRWFFFVLWLGVLASTASVVEFVVGANIGPTTYCTTFSTSEWSAVASIVPLVFDTLVFVAITVRLTQMSVRANEGVKTSFKISVLGEYLPRLSRSMLKDGQIYYLTTVTSNITALAMLHASMAPEYRIMGALPNLVLTNIMACAAFRNLRTGFGSTTVTEMYYSDPSQPSIAYAVPSGRRHGSSGRGRSWSTSGASASWARGASRSRGVDLEDGELVTGRVGDIRIGLTEPSSALTREGSLVELHKT